MLKEEKIAQKQEECRGGFSINDGRSLDEALGKLKVHREAYYYGGTFTGNHAHKCLKVHCQTNQFCIYTHNSYSSLT